MRWARLASTFAIAVGAVACAAIWGFDDLKPGATFMDGGGGSDASDATVSDVGPGCTLAKPPGKPSGADNGSIDFLNALSFLDVGVHAAGADASAPTGIYDLDDKCTFCGTQFESCVRSKIALANGKGDTTCDLDGGVDNVASGLLSTLNVYVMGDKLTTEAANNWLKAGRFTLLVAIRGYNGTPDDPKVEVDLAPSFGLGTSVDGGPITSFSAPTFTAADNWTYWPQMATSIPHTNPNTNFPLSTPPNASALQAYVKSGTIVATFAHTYFVVQLQILTDNPLILHLTDVTVSARVVGPDWHLEDGHLSGKWATGDLLRGIGVWSMGIASLCPGDSIYSTVRDKLCERRDVRIGVQDNTQPCDGVSLGFGFATAPASMGSPSTYGFKATNCYDGGYNPMPTYVDNCDFNK